MLILLFSTHHFINNLNIYFINNKLLAYCEIGLKDPTFLKCLGISKDYDSKDYILVMKYALMGSLRKNIYSVSQMEWKKN